MGGGECKGGGGDDDNDHDCGGEEDPLDEVDASAEVITDILDEEEISDEGAEELEAHLRSLQRIVDWCVFNDDGEYDMGKVAAGQAAWEVIREATCRLQSQAFDGEGLERNIKELRDLGWKFHKIVTDGDVKAPQIIQKLLHGLQFQALCYIHRVRTLYKPMDALASTAKDYYQRAQKHLRVKTPKALRPAFMSAEWGPTCSCTRATGVEGKTLKGATCIRTGAGNGFARRLQDALNSAIGSVPKAFLPSGQPNPLWKGKVHCKLAIRDEIQRQIDHLFDLNHDGCKHSAKWAPRSGTVVTCPHQQKQILYLVETTVLSVLDSLVVEGYGPVCTNVSEVIGSIALMYRRKTRYLGAYHLHMKELLGLCHAQALAFKRLGVQWLWQEELYSRLQDLYAFPSNEPLLTAGMVAGWIAMSNKRLAQSKARQELKAIQYRATQKKLSRRKNDWNKANSKQEYNHFHVGAFWEQSRAKAEKKNSEQWERATGKPKQAKKCNGCDEVVSRHTTRNCPWAYRAPKPAGKGTKRKSTS